MVSTEQAIAHTRKWLETFIIKHSICPFAKREYDREMIRFCVTDADAIEDCLATLLLECQYLESNPACATTFIILTAGYSDFETYLTLIEIAENLLTLQGYEGHYQIASFHSQYRFANAPSNDPANFTNRSPYPMLHLLRESAIEGVLQTYPNPEQIPERNIQYTRHLGHAVLQKILADCY